MANRWWLYTLNYETLALKKMLFKNKYTHIQTDNLTNIPTRALFSEHFYLKHLHFTNFHTQKLIHTYILM